MKEFLDNYMQQLRNSFGQQMVYGIITTLEEWRILYLPNSSSSSKISTSWSPSTGLGSATQTFSLNRKEDIQSLITVIANAIRISHSSPYLQLPLLSEDRVYLIFNKDGILWGKFPKNSRENKSIKFGVPKLNSSLQISILRSFTAGADGNAYLGLTQNFDLVVVKKFTNLKSDNPNAYNNYRKYWPLTTDKATVPIGKKKNTLVLPFAFPCLQQKDGEFYFEFNLSKLGSLTENIIEDERFTDLSTKFIEYYAQHPITPENALMSAVALFASKKCVHEDIKWRHVALLPEVTIFQKHVRVEGLTPIFIDLSRVHDIDDVQTARNVMLQNVKGLLDKLHSKQRASKVNVKRTTAVTERQTVMLSTSSLLIPQVGSSSEIETQHNKGDFSSQCYNLSLSSTQQSGQTSTSQRQKRAIGNDSEDNQPKKRRKDKDDDYEEEDDED